MITVKEYPIEQFYPTLKKWLDAHKSEDVPERIIDRIFVAESGPVQMASLCLYLCSHGKIAVLEHLTTNPSVCYSRDLVLAVNALYKTLEDISRDSGCLVVIGWAAENSGEYRLMVKIGYKTSQQVNHILMAKPLY
jgi:hypothetical protein